MAFTKSAMQEELIEFMSDYASGVDRIYSAGVTAILSSTACIQESMLWRAVNEMYDFGIMGIPVEGLGAGKDIDSYHCDSESFLNSIASGGMDDYFYEADIRIPWLSVKAMRTAIARHVMEGGERATDYGAAKYGLGNTDWGYVTLAEVALLADMDERSVRNAANPKVADPLKTVTVGKRSLVTPEEAKRWLSGRKGFIPTQIKNHSDIATQSHITEIRLPGNIAHKLTIAAQQAGLSISDYVEKCLEKADKEKA